MVSFNFPYSLTSGVLCVDLPCHSKPLASSFYWLLFGVETFSLFFVFGFKTSSLFFVFGVGISSPFFVFGLIGVVISSSFAFGLLGGKAYSSYVVT